MKWLFSHAWQTPTKLLGDGEDWVASAITFRNTSAQSIFSRFFSEQ